MSNFAFLKAEWPDVHDAAARAEALANSDARASCFYARRALELAVTWLYQRDRALKLPYDTQLSALIHEPSFRNSVGSAVFAKARIIKDLGNQAVHQNKTIRQYDALSTVRELFHVCFWIARTYAKGAKPPDGLAFDPTKLPAAGPGPVQAQAQLQAMAAELAEKNALLNAALSDSLEADKELKRLRDEVTKIKAANAARPDTHDYSEAQTRDFFIDLLLREAGWPLDQPRDREYEVPGMPNKEDKGFVDYVLWGDDGKPLALVEAKRTQRDARAGQQQAKLYADCLEKEFGRRPVIFYSNGYEHWIWDDISYPPRPIQGFLKKAELELTIQRRTTRQSLGQSKIDGAIVERYYQTRAIRRIAESFEGHERKALVVMATGAGKTRTVIALCDLLMRCNWVKRVLFLADRVALVNQAVGAFKKHLPASSPVNLVTEKDTGGRVYVSTYPTMMGLIDQTADGERKFGVGHFDLIIIDEAHRSVYQKYRAIFEYFDSLLVGLTATPKDEVDRNTYSLFELETGVPTDVYELKDAVNDGFLVPAAAVSVPIKFQREGITYADLSEEDRDRWDALEWSEDGEVPDRVDPAAVNKWLFNIDTVDKVLEHLMTRGLKVADGDRLGKTIVFAKNHDHANFIVDRFNANYPHYKGEFARVIDFKVEYTQSLIDSFSQAEKAPHIAISVDMLDTGIDIPEVVNLVFFKLVRSKTKFWQMLGRGTRLRPGLFGLGKNKECFYLFDYCGNLEFFGQNPTTTEGATVQSLGARLFIARLDLLGELDKEAAGDRVKEPAASYEPRDVRAEIARWLHQQVAAMNLGNFIVRKQRRLVEKYAKAEAWQKLTDEDRAELAHAVAGLPSELVDDDLEAKRFDMLMLRLEIAVLRAEPSFERLRDSVRTIAASLEEKDSIPMVHEQMALIQEIQTDEYWQDVTLPMLEQVRRRLRALAKFVDKTARRPVYTDFEDVMGEGTAVELPGFGDGAGFERFRSKARAFLREHDKHVVIHKLRWNLPLTPTDLQELERIMLQAGVGTSADLARAKQESAGLGLFIRSLVGMDREAAVRAVNAFLAGKTPSANQIEFLDLVVDHLTEHGVMDPARLYESPFTDINPHGPEGVFSSSQVDALVSALRDIRERAAA
ncbi:MAG: DEAD/DEAH box helicase family protein [Gemmatimonadetes bacterium]|nr:DEAD/DEAH box helicase family protein [Gemmatimonadota bacterium]